MSKEDVMSKPMQKLTKKPPVDFTEERKIQYLHHLRQTGLVWLSAEKVGVSPGTVNDHRKRDLEFDEACEVAKQMWIDEVLLSEAVRRATKGTSKPILGGKFKDEIVAYEQVYSDSLMAMLLRANRGEFKDKDLAGGGAYSNAGAGVLIIPASPDGLSQWQEKFGELAKGTHGRPEGEKK